MKEDDFMNMNKTGIMAGEGNAYHEVVQCIAMRQLAGQGDKILVALSGGADSVALLRILLRAGFSVEAAHCNFHLRGEESDRDERFVRKLCQTLSVTLHVKGFDTATYAHEKGVSVEMAARDLRYEYFEKLRQERGFDSIAVAHHRNDNVETLLLNLIRGTGLKGLTGMRYKNGYIIRPLLDVSKEEIEQYLSANGQDFVTDSSNLETVTVRNKIRLELLPLMKEINPSIVDTLQRTAHRLEETYSIYHGALEELKEQAAFSDNRISIESIKSMPYGRTVLYDILSAHGFNNAQAEEIYNQMGGNPGKIYESDAWRLLRDRDFLILKKKEDKCECLCSTLPLDGYVKVTRDLTFHIRRECCGERFVVPRGKDTACMDVDKLIYPITVRPAREGDRFVPFGMTGQRLVSDYLTDVKKNMFEKEKQLVVCSGERIAWVVGERIDERFRVDDTTTHVIVIQCMNTGQAAGV